jgi:four helix bundle protein
VGNAKDGRKEEFKKRLYAFTLKLVEFIDQLPKNDNVSHRIGDQLLRSGTSIIGNYIEGQASSSKREYVRYFQTSLKSANESKLWFALLRDARRTAREKTRRFLNELDEFGSIFASSILTMKGKR